jgi:hypothetical protein
VVPWHNSIVPSPPSIAVAKIAVETSEKVIKVLTFPAPVRVKNPAAVALGKLGGSKGGKMRAERLSPEARKAIAQQAAKARWAKVKGE